MRRASVPEVGSAKKASKRVVSLRSVLRSSSTMSNFIHVCRHLVADIRKLSVK